MRRCGLGSRGVRGLGAARVALSVMAWGVSVGVAGWGSAQEAEPLGARGVIISGGIVLPIPWPSGMGIYLHNEVGRDFRLQPEPGYYPYLQDRTNTAFDSYGNTHLRLGFVRDGLEISFDFFQMGWSEAVVTHVSNTRLDVVGKQFDDTSAVYLPVDSDEASSIRAEMGQEGLRRDVSDLNLVPLRIYHLGGGLRHQLWRGAPWEVWVPWSGGLVLTTLSDAPGAFDVGLALSGGLGASYDVSELISLEVGLRYWLMLTTTPGDFQTNANRAQAVGATIFSALFEVFHFADLNVALRLNIF
jgi:hypothetical protein